MTLWLKDVSFLNTSRPSRQWGGAGGNLRSRLGNSEPQFH